MKKRIRQIVSIIIIGSLVVTSLFACAKVPKGVVTDSGYFAATKLLATSDDLFNNLEESELLNSSPVSDVMYFSKQPDADLLSLLWRTEESYFRSSADFEGKMTSTVKLEGVEGESLAATQCAENRIFLLTVIMDKSTLRDVIKYYVIDEEGKIELSGELNDTKNRTVIDAESNMQSDVYIFLDDSMITLNIDTGITARKSADNSMVLDFAFISDDRIWALETDSEEGRTLSEFSTKNMKRKALQYYPADEAFVPECICTADASSGGGIYLASFQGIAKYNEKDATLTKLLDTSEKQLEIYPSIGMAILSENEFILLGMYVFSSGDIEGLIGISLSEQQAQKQVLRLAAAYDDSSCDLEMLAFLFNENSPDYQIEVLYYDAYTSIEDLNSYMSARSDMILDVLGENPPDLFYLQVGEMNVLAEQDILLDIAPVIDAYISQRPNEYATNAVTAVRTDGKQCYLTPFFTVSGFTMSDEHVEMIEDFTLDGFMAYADQRGLSLLGDHYSYSLVEAFQMSFIDRVTGKVSFDSPEFIALLNSFGQAPGDSNDASLLEFQTIRNFENYVSLSRLSATDFSVFGYPQGAIKPAILSSSMACAVHQNTPYTEGAKQFIEFVLSDTVQNMSNAFSGGEIPVSLSAMDAQIRSMSPGSPENDNGSTIVVHGSTTESDYLRPFPNDQSWEKEFKEILLSASGFYIQDYYLQQIFYEEMVLFETGEKSAEATAVNLQSRIGIYIAERAS